VAPDVIEAIAQRTADLVLERLTGGSAAPGLVDARTVADALGISAETVRDHADELGVVRLGPTGPNRRPRLRFDLAQALAWQAARSTGGRSQSSDPPVSSGTRRAKATPTVELVPIRSPQGGRRAA
jgi:hypothetical protein